MPRLRLNGLLGAVMSVGRELDLPQVLNGIVEAAVVLVGAEYGAPGVIGDDRKPAEFLPVGITDDLRARIGAGEAGGAGTRLTWWVPPPQPPR